MRNDLEPAYARGARQSVVPPPVWMKEFPRFTSLYQRNHLRALIIGPPPEENLRLLFAKHGYLLEHCPTSLEGMRKVRAQKPSMVVLYPGVMKGRLDRKLRFFRMVRENIFVFLVASEEEHFHIPSDGVSEDYAHDSGRLRA